MLMVGDMFNHGLKAKVAALCEEIAALLDTHDRTSEAEGSSSLFVVDPAQPAGGTRWPEELGTPTSTGSQNDMHYAVFPQTRRLAIASGDALTIYDTGDHRISGLGQQQGATGSITLTSQHGPVRLDDLAVVREGGAASSSSVIATEPTKPGAPTSDPRSPGLAMARAPVGAKTGENDHNAIFAKIEGLAGLHAKGHLTDEEFREKKTDLLARL
jgi:hypothetical protein